MPIGSPQWMYKSGEAYEIDQSLKFNDDNSAYLSRTPSSAGNRQTWTFSFWYKIGTNDGANSFLHSADDSITFGTDHKIAFACADGTTRWNTLLRDHSSWYHIIIAYDSTQSTAANRVKLYINGTQQTDDNSTYPSLNRNTTINNASAPIYISSNATPGGSLLDGYMAEAHFIDGTAKVPADFGETGDYGEWKPIEYSGTYGTNGFYLPFKNDYSVEGFSTTLYKGSGGTNSLYVGGVGFSPSLVWLKNREANNNGHHFLWDKLRGAGASKALRTNVTNAEGMPNTSYDRFTRFDNDGFSFIGGQYNAAYINSAQPYVAWSWDMGAATPTGFGCVTYEGTQRAVGIGGMGFKPDLLWIKNRDTTDWHQVTDAIRGVDKQIFPNATDAGDNATNKVTSFDSDGFSLGLHESVNTNMENYVAWGWDMGGTSVANTTGDINTTVMANPTYGQSIVAWTGTGSGSSPTVGHGLSSAPEMVIVKHTDAVGVWAAQHEYDTTKYFQMQDVDAASTGATVFDNTAPTSSVFTINATNAVTNQSGGDYIAYCFHSVAGYSKIDSYSGTGSSQTITLGFRPAWVMVKRANETHNWYMFDSTRNPLGQFSDNLLADAPNAEGSDNVLGTITDTGFTLVNDNGFCNESGDTYIYMAFAGGMDSISDYNTTGSIDSRVKANPTYGQSIVSYTGASGAQTIGHGLSSTPEMIIVKNRSSAQEWLVYHANNTAAPETDYLRLDTNSATTDNTFWNDTAPTSSVFSVGDSQPVNSGHGNDYIAYCWHSVTGYSSVGSWVGNANDTGPVITTGFAPAWVMYKKIGGAADWVIVDNVRNPTGIKNLVLHPNDDVNPSETTSADAGQSLIFLSTGFQPGGAGGDMNGNNETYVYMAFADKREYAYWLDQSGNNNDWTSNNLTESDISVDSPTNNFATWNPLHIVTSNSPTFAEGNLQVTTPNSGAGNTVSTMGVTSGKWYAEVLPVSYTSLPRYNVAITGDAGGTITANTNIGSLTSSFDVGYFFNGTKFVGNSETASWGDSYDAGDIMGIALNADDNEVTFYKNNVSQGAISFTAGGTYHFAYGDVSAGGGGNTVGNFGQDSSFAGNKTAQGNQDGNDIGDFYYTPPTGFLALCTSNLPDVAVVPSEHFNTTLFTGDGTSNRDITGTGFNPDLNWLKMRSGVDNHVLTDVLRGTNHLHTNTNSADSDISYPALVTDGFRVSGGTYNNDTYTFVAWQWKANGSGSSNTDGDVTSTVSANVDAGFSIVTYTGNGSNIDIGHGLSKAPEIVIVKVRNDTGGWYMNLKNIPSQSAGTDMVGVLNTTDAINGMNVGQWYFGSQAPTSSVFRVQNKDDVGENGDTHVAYCFHSVDGYSKIGSYTGNGNADGTFIYTGFRPAYVLIKRTNSAGQGSPIFDSARNEFNVTDKRLNSNDSVAEVTTDGNIDLLSNGFKARNTDGSVNTSGGEYIYLAFAETPFKYSNAR